MGGCVLNSRRHRVVIVIAAFLCVATSQDVASMCKKYTSYCKIWKVYIDLGYKSLQPYYDLCECGKQETITTTKTPTTSITTPTTSSEPTTTPTTTTTTPAPTTTTTTTTTTTPAPTTTTTTTTTTTPAPTTTTTTTTTPAPTTTTTTPAPTTATTPAPTTTTTTTPSTTTTPVPTTRATTDCGYPAKYCSVWATYIEMGYTQLQPLYDRCHCDKIVNSTTTTPTVKVTETTTPTTTPVTTPTTTRTTTTTTDKITTTTTSSLLSEPQCGISSKIDDASKYIGSSVLRIVGGNTATECEFPWMVVVIPDTNTNSLCSGSLIDRSHVITAGHCAFHGIKSPEDVLVGLGSSDKRKMKYVSVKKVYRHPNYTSSFNNDDIAIITLTDPVDYSACVQPICLATRPVDIPVGTTCLASGWGLLKEGGSIRPDVLQEVKLPVVSLASCAQVYGNSIDENKICAGYKDGGKDSCTGDSGGPLACAIGKQWVMIGDVSSGSGCARKNTPGVYTYLPNYYAWIDEVRKL